MILQLLIVLGALWVGSRYGSLALGAISGIGKYLLNHSFMMPGLICVTVSTIVAYLLTLLIF